MIGPTLRPMSEFETSKPAVMHDQLNEKMVAWTGEDAAHCGSALALPSTENGALSIFTLVGGAEATASFPFSCEPRTKRGR